MSKQKPLKPCPLKAYSIYFSDFISVVMAKSRSKAQYATWKSANDAGYQYPFLEVSRMSCIRAKGYDHLKLKEGHCYALDYVQSLTRRPRPEKESEK